MLHGAEQGNRVEVVKEAKVRNAEDLALHFTLAVGRDQSELRLECLDHVAGVHPFRNSDRSGRSSRSGGREEREAQRDKAGTGRCGVELSVVDQRDAALLEIASALARDVVERCTKTGNQRNRGRVGAFALDRVLAFLAEIEVVAWIL